MCYNTELTKANKDHIKRYAADFLRDVGKVKRVFILSEQENTSNEAKVIKSDAPLITAKPQAQQVSELSKVFSKVEVTKVPST